MNIKSQRRYRTFLFTLVYFIVMMGIAQVASTSGMSQEKEYLYSFALALVLTQVCIVDSRIAGKPLSIFSYWLVFFFYGIAVPFSIVRARGPRGLVYVAVHFIGMALTLIISFYVAGLLFGTL